MGKSLLKVHKVDLSQAPLEFRWYNVKTLYKHERNAAENITNNMRAQGYGDYIAEIITPLIEEVKTTTRTNKAGQTKTTKKTVMNPVYGLDTNIWIKMILNSDTWSIVRNSSGVAGWLNSDGRPHVLTEQEIQDIKRMVGLLEKEKREAAERFDGKQGDLVKINDGPMSGFEGTILEVNQEKKTLEILLPNGIRVAAEFHQADKV